MPAVYMERSDCSRNLARFYQVEKPTLFGEWAVIRRWGRIGTYGNMRQDWFTSLAEAQGSCDHRVACKRRRGRTSEFTASILPFRGPLFPLGSRVFWLGGPSSEEPDSLRRVLLFKLPSDGIVPRGSATSASRFTAHRLFPN
jgi:predicted DNA-binding WGR domain protein